MEQPGNTEKMVFHISERNGWEPMLDRIHKIAKAGHDIAVVFDGDAALSFVQCDHESRNLVKQLVIDGVNVWVSKDAIEKQDKACSKVPDYLPLTTSSSHKLAELVEQGYIYLDAD